jgi:hypothetical protein
VGKQGSGCVKALVIAGVLGGVVLVVAVAAVFLLGRTVRTGTADASDYQLTGPECTINRALGPQASGRITNTSGRDQSFEVEVRFTARTDGSLISQNTDVIDVLDDGQSTDWKVTTLDDPPADGLVDCVVSEVRYSEFGG